MISFNDLGRKGNLGNQMFQYAGLRGIAHNRSLEWVIPPPGPHWIHGSQILNAFEMSGLNDANFSLTKFRTYFSPGKRDGRNSTGFQFDSHLFHSVPDNVNLRAFFQSPKYFGGIEEEIRKDFTLKDEVLDKVTREYPHTLDQFISLHVRRGDYLRVPKHHPVQSLDFYAAALESLPKMEVLITTDDPSWVSNQRLFQQKRFKLVSSSEIMLDFAVQTRAAFSIISNSSFSWWGAWLARPSQVIAPRIWFGPKLKHLSIQDLYPEDWVLL